MILIRTAAWPIGLLGAALSCYSAAAAIAPAQVVPAEVRQALADADVPLSHVALLARPVGEPQGGWRAGEPMNPASVMKLLTTLPGWSCSGRGTAGRRRFGRRESCATGRSPAGWCAAGRPAAAAGALLAVAA